VTVPGQGPRHKRIRSSGAAGVAHKLWTGVRVSYPGSCQLGPGVKRCMT